jgi:hypothetical protein
MALQRSAMFPVMMRDFAPQELEEIFAGRAFYKYLGPNVARCL